MSRTELEWKKPLPDNLKSLPLREKEINARLRQIQMQHLNKEISISIEPGETGILTKELEEIYDKLVEYDSQYVSLRCIKPLSLIEIQSSLVNTEIM
jgi:hypothetical protein